MDMKQNLYYYWDLDLMIRAAYEEKLRFVKRFKPSFLHLGGRRGKNPNKR